MTTKLFVPRPRQGQVTRHRLLGKLDTAVDPKLTLVCAPAGFGKTSLLSQWLQSRKTAAAWFSLDSGDNDPVRFWHHLLAAVEKVAPGLPHCALMGPGSARSLDYEITLLVNALAEISDSALTIVLDDYHLIDEPIVHDAVQLLLDHLPAHVEMVIATRTDPPLSLAVMRARGELVEMREADLRFDTEESSDLLAEVTGRTLDSAALGVLLSRTEGWAAGLHLAGLSLRQHPDADRFLTEFSGSHRYVFDYLTQEVLDRQPPELRDFLFETSILDRLSGPLCDALTGRSDSQEMLAAVERAGLFLVALDDTRQWWRYHRLFADVLRTRLQHQRPERYVELHRAAAAWHDEQHLPDNAVSHALAAGAPDWAARLVERYFDEYILGTAGATVRRWISNLPSDVVSTRPRLLLGQARTEVYAGRLDLAEVALEAVDRAMPLPADDEFRPSIGPGASQFEYLEAAILGTRMVVANLKGCPEAALAYGEAASKAVPDASWMIRAGIEQQVGTAHLVAGRLDEAEKAMVASLRTWRHHGQHDFPAWMSYYLGRVYYARGELDRAFATHEESMRLDGGDERSPETARPALSMAHVGLAEVAYQWNELELALSHAEQGVRLARRFIASQPLASGLAILAAVQHVGGDADGAARTMEEAHQVADPTRSDLSNPVGVTWARLQLEQGDVATAENWVAGRNVDPAGHPTYSAEPALLLWCRIQLARDRPKEALEVLDRLETPARSQGRVASLIRIGALSALARAQTGDVDIASLAEVLRLAHTHGFVRAIVDEGQPMAELVGEFVRAGTDDRDVPLSYLNQITTAFSRQLAPGRAARMPGLVVPLTEREMEVLRLMAAGRRNQEIADEIFVSLNTTKKHVTHILDKLGAHNRTEAVDRSRQLGLIR